MISCPFEAFIVNPPSPSKNKGMGKSKVMGRLFSKPSKILIWCFWAAIIFIFSYDFFLSQIPEKIPGGNKFGSIFYKICFAFVTSYIFYFVNVHLKKKDDKKNLSPYLAKKSIFIFGRLKGLIPEISKASGITFNTTYPTREELLEACKRIPPNSAAPMLTSPANIHLTWTQYLNYHRSEVTGAIQKMFALMPHLESKHIKILSDIDECFFFKMLIAFESIPTSNADLEYLHDSFFKYTLLIKELESYYNEKLKSFST